jgi:hypothetical protein
MRKVVSRAGFTALFALSVGALVTTFGTIASAAPLGPLACPSCQQVTLTCPGSTCNCEWNDFGQDYECRIPVN